ncbi:MAG: alpha/beta hydrolase [Chitinophagales bacterium]
MKKGLMGLAIAICSIYLLICTAFYFYQESFIFHPRELEQDYQYKFSVDFDEKMYDTPNAGKINALHFKAENSKGVVFYLHGNAGCLDDWGWLYQDFLPRGYDLLIIDYRTYGKSTGKMSEQNLFGDIQYIYDDLAQQYDESQIIVYGRSIGTGMATKVASDNNPKHLILETPYYNLNDVVKRVIPIFPTRLLLRYPLPSNENILKVDCPIHIIHGTNDNVIKYQSGENLAACVGEEKCTFITVEGGEHNNLSGFIQYSQLLADVLEK